MENARILVVDDELIIAADLRQKLTRMGFAVIKTVVSGTDAIRCVEDQRPDLVLMDIRLQGEMDGVEAAAIIRARFDIPVIFMTAYPTDDVLERAKVTEPYGYILKPFETRELQSCIKIALYKHQMERRLKEKEEYLSITLQAIGDGVIAINMEGTVTLINKAAETLTGWAEIDALGKPFSIIFKAFYEESRVPIPNPLDSINRAHGVAQIPQAAILVSKAGTEYAVANSCAPIHDRAGRIVGIVIVFRDITEIRHLEHAKTQFFNAISHELRTPLTPILGYVDMMLNVELSEAQRRQFLNSIMQAVLRESELVNELITVARLEYETETCRLQEVDAAVLMNDLIESSRAFIARMVSARDLDSNQITYQTKIDAYLSGVMLNLDRRKIQQAVENLISNAIKFSTPNQIWIELRATLHSSFVEIAVQDTGRGIPRIETERIFKPFYQIRSGENDISDGIGQGLPIVKRYLELHGGSVNVESTVGAGSTFKLLLPIYAQAN